MNFLLPRHGLVASQTVRRSTTLDEFLLALNETRKNWNTIQACRPLSGRSAIDCSVATQPSVGRILREFLGVASFQGMNSSRQRW